VLEHSVLGAPGSAGIRTPVPLTSSARALHKRPDEDFTGGTPSDAGQVGRCRAVSQRLGR
jgi:hypothetical protein